MNLKSPILPHLALWGTFILIVVVGVATNSGAVGTLIGTSAALASDPILLIAALLTGALTKDYKKFWILVAVIGTAVILNILPQVIAYRRELGLSSDGDYAITSFIYRMGVFIMLAHLSNIVRQKISRKTEEE